MLVTGGTTLGLRVLDPYWDYSGGVAEPFWKCTGASVEGLRWYHAGITLVLHCTERKLCWNYAGTVLELHWNCTGAMQERAQVLVTPAVLPRGRGNVRNLFFAGKIKRRCVNGKQAFERDIPRYWDSRAAGFR